MPTDPSVIDYVLGSSVRRTVLRRIGRADSSTATLLEELPASESAIYDALSELAAENLIDRRGDEQRWSLTGAGRIVLDRIETHDRAETLLETDRRYWRNHRVDVLPDPYRREIHTLADSDLIRATGLDPNGPLREVAETIENAERIDLAAVVYNQRIGEAFLEASAEKRLILNTTLIEEYLLEEGETNWEQLDATVRVTDVPAAIVLTGSEAFVSLPPQDGLFDPQTVLHSEATPARRWARRLFRHYWIEATPLAEYLEWDQNEADES